MVKRRLDQGRRETKGHFAETSPTGPLEEAETNCQRPGCTREMVRIGRERPREEHLTTRFIYTEIDWLRAMYSGSKLHRVRCGISSAVVRYQSTPRYIDVRQSHGHSGKLKFGQMQKPNSVGRLNDVK